MSVDQSILLFRLLIKKYGQKADYKLIIIFMKTAFCVDKDHKMKEALKQQTYNCYFVGFYTLVQFFLIGHLADTSLQSYSQV